MISSQLKTRIFPQTPTLGFILSLAVELGRICLLVSGSVPRSRAVSPFFSASGATPVETNSEGNAGKTACLSTTWQCDQEANQAHLIPQEQAGE